MGVHRVVAYVRERAQLTSVSAEELGEDMRVRETYYSNLQPSLLAFPLTFWGSRQVTVTKDDYMIVGTQTI